MPILEKPQEQLEYEREIELEDQAHWNAVEEAKRAHELTLTMAEHKKNIEIARIKFATAPRQVAVSRVLLALIKVPALVILAIAVPVLVGKGREVPAVLTEFMTL